MPEFTNQGFSKSERLLSPAEFRTVFRSGQRLHTSLFSLIVHNNGIRVPRLGLAISKKNVRRAVDRNRIKRIIREWFRTSKDRLAGRDIIVMAKPAVNQSNNHDLVMALEQAMRKSLQR